MSEKTTKKQRHGGRLPRLNWLARSSPRMHVSWLPFSRASPPAAASDLRPNKKHTEKKGAISGKVCTSLMTPVFISVMRHFFHFHSRLLEASNCKRWDLHEY